MNSRLMVRRNRTAALGLIPVVIIVIALLVGTFVLLGSLTDPTRAKNDCGDKGVAYARSSGSYSVSAYLGDPHGEFSVLKIDVTQLPSPGGGLHLPLGSFFGTKGKVHVEISVTGPGGVSIADWRSEERDYDFPVSDELNGASRPGDFVDGLTCFQEHGTSSWHFALVWKGNDGFTKVLQTQDRVVNV